MKNRLLILLGGAFVLSGFSALLYQVVWHRMLGLFTGSDVLSVTIITGAYLAGLGVGSLAGGVLADRLSSRAAVRGYALFNIGIALYALLSRTLYYDVLFRQFNYLAESRAGTFVVVFLSLLIPTTLMGMSLPLVARAAVQRITGAAAIISRLYASNTLGAAAGAGLGAWVLTGTLGYEGALWLGASVSLAVALIAFLIGGSFDGADTTATTVALREVPDSGTFSARTFWEWCGLVFISGFIVFSLEVVWFRVLDFILKSNVYTYGHLLMFFLAGDALGSLWGTRHLPRIQHPRRLFMQIQGWLALYALGATLLVAAALANEGSALAQYNQSSSGFVGEIAGTPYVAVLVFLVVPAVVLLPPAFMIGYYFPVVQKALQNDLRVIGRRVGFVEVANIAGNTLGAIVTGVILLNILGSADTLRLVGGVGVVFMAVMLWQERAVLTARQRVVNGVAAGVLAVLTLAFPSTETFWRMMHGAGQRYAVVDEDATGISVVLDSGTGAAAIWANGRDQGYFPPLEWHTFIGALPALVHPDPQRIAIVGLGSAGSPYGAGINPDSQSIDVIELIGSELDVLRQFAASGDSRAAMLRAMFDDVRYTFVVGDGRRELFLATERFDVILTDAVLPWTSHAGLLYSAEFYDLLRSRLAPGGIVVQWRPTDRVEATFVRAFPYVTLIGDIVMVGSLDPIPYDAAALWQRLQQPDAHAYMSVPPTAPDAWRYWILDVPVQVWTADTPRPDAQTLSDLFPRDEYHLNQSFTGVRFPIPNTPYFLLR